MLRVGRRHNGVAVDLFARLEHHADRLIAAQQHLLYRCIGAGDGAKRLCCAGDRRRHGAGAALRQRPLAERAVDLAEVVMQEDHARAWRLDAQEGADDARCRHGADERLPLKPAAQEVVGATGDQIEKGTLGAQRQMAEVFGETGVLEPLFRIAIRVGCRHVDGGANEAGDVGDGLLEIVVVVGVAVRPLANLAQGVGVIGAAIEVAIPVRGVGAHGWRHL